MPPSIGIGSPLRAKSSIFERNASLVVPRCASKSPLDLSDLSVQQKQDHSFATHTKQRTLVKLFGLHATCILVSQSDKNYTTSANENGQNWNIHKKPLHFSTHCRTIFSLLRGSSLSPTGSGPVLVSNVRHEETQALVHHCLVLDLDNQKDCHCFCTIRPGENLSFSQRCSLLSSTRSCWLHSCIISATFLTTSSFALLASLSGLVLGVQILGALRCFLRRHIPYNIVCGDPPSVSWFEHPTERYDSRDHSLWLFAAHVSWTVACLMLSRHPSLKQSYLSAHLRCAAYISRVSACWLCS